MRADAEFLAYISKAEQRLSASEAPLAEALLGAYENLKLRFHNDLGEGRDELVSCAGALMLAEAILRLRPRE